MFWRLLQDVKMPKKLLQFRNICLRHEYIDILNTLYTHIYKYVNIHVYKNMRFDKCML